MAESIKVTTKQLAYKKEELKKMAEAAKQSYLKATQAMAMLEVCFQSEGITHFQRSISLEQEKGEKAFLVLFHHIEKLSCITDTYEEAERRNLHVRKG